MRWPPKLSALSWVMLTAMLNLLLAGGIVYYDLKQTEGLISRHEQDRLEAIRHSLKQALTTTCHRADDATAQLAAWEESRAQFLAPSYYFFWRQNSLPGSRYWLPGMVDARLYRTDGRPLEKADASNEHLPKQLPPDQLSKGRPFSQVVTDSLKNHVEYQRFVPVISDDGRIIGWAGAAFDLFRLMQLSYPLQYFTTSQLRVRSSGIYPPKTLPDILAVHLLPDRVAQSLLSRIKQHALIYLMLLSVMMMFNALVAWWLFYRPLKHLNARIERDDLRPDRSMRLPVRELDQFFHTLTTTHEKHQNALMALQKSRDELKTLALHDPVTGLFNRTALTLHLQDAQNPLHARDMAFALMDIAHFRALNDTYGPIKGDMVLEEIAHVLSALDASARIYRLGGDEFAILMPETCPESLNLKLQALARKLAGLDLTPYDIHLSIQVRFGAVLRKADEPCALHTCLAEADAALLSAKTQRHTVQIFHEGLREQCMLLNTDRIELIRKAVFSGENLLLYRQPIVSHRSNGILYHELLVRIRHVDKHLQPAQIFQVIDRRHWHIELDRQVIRLAHRALLNGEIPAGQGISINLSGQTLMGEHLVELLAPLAPWLSSHTLVVEVLENHLIDKRESVTRKLQALRERGFLVALDDFGSGHASIAYLAELPVDIIKLDRSLTLRLKEQDSRQAAILRRLLHFMHEAGYHIVLEGIDDAKLCETLCSLPADGLQGFLFAPPSPHTLSEQDIHRPCPCHTSSH